MLPYLIAGAIGFGIGKLFEEGGETFGRGGKADKKYYWIKMDRSKIDEYIDYASRMMGMFEGEIYTQAPNKVAFDTENDMFAFTSMIENHNNDNDFQEGDEGYIYYEELFNGEPRPNMFDKIIGNKYAGGGNTNWKSLGYTFKTQKEAVDFIENMPKKEFDNLGELTLVFNGEEFILAEVTKKKNTKSGKKNTIKDWYIKNYPTDDLGEELNEITFEELWNEDYKKYNIYQVMGVADSVIRERLFEHLAEIKGVTYGEVYRKLFSSEGFYAGGGGVETQKSRVIDYYINNADNEDLITLMGVRDFPNLIGVAEKWVNNRDTYYDKIFNAIDGIHNRTWGENKFVELGLEKFADGGGVGNTTARTYDGINSLRSYQKNNIEEIQEYIADNGTIIELVAMNDRDSSSGMTFAVTINGRGIYANRYREDAKEFYKDEIAKYKNNYKYDNGGGVDEFIGYEDWNDENRTHTKFFIEPYDKNIEWHNGEDVFRGTYNEVKNAEANFYKEFEEDEYAEGGVAKKRRRRANTQTGRTDRSVDKTRVGKPVGYRFSNSLASKLRKDQYAVPTEKQIIKYLGKGIYKENRKNRSDKDRTAKL